MYWNDGFCIFVSWCNILLMQQTIQKANQTSIEEIIHELQQGRFVAVSDDAQRENETDLIIAAERITSEQMAFLIHNTSGIICVPMLADRLEHLKLERITSNNPARFNTPFVMPVDLKSACVGGVSAPERTATVHALADLATKPDELGRPGHVFPLEAHPEGLSARQGHTEASIALMQAAGMQPVAVIGELMNERGEMLRNEELDLFLSLHGIPHIDILSISASLVDLP